MNHLPSRLVLALALVLAASGCGAGNADDASDNTGTTGEGGYMGLCESTELWEWAMWGGLERGSYGENAVVECRCSLDCAADQLCVGFREVNPDFDPTLGEGQAVNFIETRCKDRTQTVVEPRYTELRIETQPWPGAFCVDDEACADGYRCFFGWPDTSGGYCVHESGHEYCSVNAVEPSFGCSDGTWCDRSAVSYVSEGMPPEYESQLLGECLPGACVPGEEYCDRYNPADSCCSGKCDTLADVCLPE